MEWLLGNNAWRCAFSVMCCAFQECLDLQALLRRTDNNKATNTRLVHRTRTRRPDSTHNHSIKQLSKELRSRRLVRWDKGRAGRARPP